MDVWAADGEMGLMRGGGGEFIRLGPPANALCALQGRVYCAGADAGACLDGCTGEGLFDFPVPPGVCALCPFQGMLCALSAEADCVWAYDPETGAVLLSAPAGVYPRDMCPSPSGKFLAVAGGAAGEILILDGGLQTAARYRTAGTVCGVCFGPKGLMALCAAGEEQLSARLLRISPRGVAEEVFTDPRPPASLCAAGDGGCLVGCQDGAALLRWDGRITARQSCAWPARLRPLRGDALICDSWQGEVKTLSGRVLYRGKEPLDALVLSG